jgi:hypothetical protein
VGSKSNSRNSTTTTNLTTQSTINTVDNREVQGDNAIVGGNITTNTGESSQVSITSTDFGAVKAGLDVALESLDFARSTQAGSAASTQKALQGGYDLAQAARQSETSGAINNFLKFGAIVLVVGIVAYAVTRTR